MDDMQRLLDNDTGIYTHKESVSKQCRIQIGKMLIPPRLLFEIHRQRRILTGIRYFQQLYAFGQLATRDRPIPGAIHQNYLITVQTRNMSLLYQ